MLENCVWCGFWILDESELSKEFCDTTCFKCEKDMREKGLLEGRNKPASLTAG